MKFDIIVIPKNKITTDLKKEFDVFSEENWDEHVDSPGEIRNKFFLPFDYAILGKVEENQIVGLLGLHIKRDLKFKNISFSAGSIGGVVTHKQFRHKGVATKILKKAIQVFKNEKVDIAMLCTEIDKLGPLYQKVGFVPLGRPYYFTQKDGKEGVENGGMVTKINSQKIFNEILNSKEKLDVGESNF